MTVCCDWCRISASTVQMGLREETSPSEIKGGGMEERGRERGRRKRSERGREREAREGEIDKLSLN